MTKIPPVFLSSTVLAGIAATLRAASGNSVICMAVRSQGCRIVSPVASPGMVPAVFRLSSSSRGLSPVEAARAIRKMVLAASTDFAEYFAQKGLPQSSLLRGTEHILLPPDQAAGQVVLSLGSGPDVFRPIFSFPLAGEYHLVDTLHHWSRSPRFAIEQMFRRLQFLSASHQVRVLDEGFLRHVSERDVAFPTRFRTLFRRHPECCRPVIIEAPIRFKGRDVVKRYFFHPFSYYDTDRITALYDSHLDGKKVGAIMVTGVRWAKKNMDAWLSRLERGAVLITESFVWKSSLDEKDRIVLNKARSFITRKGSDPRKDLLLDELLARYQERFVVQFALPHASGSTAPSLPRGTSPHDLPIIFRRR